MKLSFIRVENNNAACFYMTQMISWIWNVYGETGKFAKHFAMKRKSIRAVKFKLEQNSIDFIQIYAFCSFSFSIAMIPQKVPLRNEASMRLKIYGWSILWR